MQLILASASPRRRELLGLFHIPFTIRVADIDETMDPAASPFDEVARVSRLKALAVEAGEDDIVIAADTIVVCQGRVLPGPCSGQTPGRRPGKGNAPAPVRPGPPGHDRLHPPPG